LYTLFMKKFNPLSLIFIFFFGFFIFSGKIARIYTDYLWMKSQGFSQVFFTELFSEFGLLIGVGLMIFLFGIINLVIAGKEKLSILIILASSFLGGIIASSYWQELLLFFNPTSFNKVDPIFNLDISFYFFTLPIIKPLIGIVIFSIVSSLIAVALSYFKKLIPSLYNLEEDGSIHVNDLLSQHKAIKHCSILISLIFVGLAFFHYFSLYDILYSSQGVVFGAGYTDIYVLKPLIYFSVILALISSALVVHAGFTRKLPKISAGLMILYFFMVMIGTPAATELVHSLKVSPNEIVVEKPYLLHNLEYTRAAYNLDSVEEREFELSELNSDKAPDNVRILDWRPLTQTYKQTQEMRLYYDLAEVDIDRYVINEEYTEVMLSPRELDINQISPEAQTWINRHLVYTHGYGIVMSPVDKVTDQGLPEFIIKDVPPIYTVDEPKLKIDVPQIYYGEKKNDYSLVNTKTEEFDFPKGNSNSYTNYAGKGGVMINSFIDKLAFAIRFADIKILLSSELSENTKIQFLRSVKERVNKIAPFIVLDNDPYIVIENGKLVWMIDGYTVSDKYPYSMKTGNINYIRNSVKVTIDAYHGDVTFYISDPEDPIVKSLFKIFPKMFKSLNEMPKELKKHIRYPEGLFNVQTKIFSTYHMQNPVVFYNKEDAWQIPTEIYGTGQKISVEPYYVITKLPGEKNEEFVLMTTFTPIKKDNMVAWMAARSDGDNYGKILLFKFPKDRLVYGPMQIEAKFDQDSEISQQLTLWSQGGSRVTRGNLLVIPLEKSILYIEPLYLQAEQGQLPELKRVLVSDGNKVKMAENLESAFTSLSSKRPEQNFTKKDFLNSALQNYKDVLEAFSKNLWGEANNKFKELGEDLDQLKEQ
jgi:uncharacterized protein